MLTHVKSKSVYSKFYFWIIKKFERFEIKIKKGKKTI